MLPGRLVFIFTFPCLELEQIFYHGHVLRLFNPDLFDSRAEYNPESTFLVLTDNFFQATDNYLPTAALSDRSAIFITGH